MAIFKKATKTQAYLKMGIMGFTGAGKTYTASQVAVGVFKHVKIKTGKKLPVYFLDTETGSDFVLEMFQESGIELRSAKTKAFVDLIPSVQEAAKAKGIIIIDSITHFWVDLQDSYMRKKKRTRLTFADWNWLKKEWRKFTDIFVNAPCHIIMCGRAGFEYDFFEGDDGKKELEKTGIRMKAETETGYEPSILVLMHREQDLGHDGVPVVKRKAVVLKDRALGQHNLDGKIFYNPTFEDFRPHVEFLNLGGKHLGTTEKNSDQIIPDDDPKWAIEKKQKEVVLDEIQTLLVKYFPSTKQEDKKHKADLLEKHFPSRSWVRIQTLKLDELRHCYEGLKNDLEPDIERDAYTEDILDMSGLLGRLDAELKTDRSLDDIQVEFLKACTSDQERIAVENHIRNKVQDGVPF